jgi:hypothetical protein
MQIKLSDYIYEQTVSDAEVANIIIEQEIAQTMVYANLCQSYIKQLMMEEYLGTDDEDESTVVEESSETNTDGVVEEASTVVIGDDGKAVSEPPKSTGTSNSSNAVAKKEVKFFRIMKTAFKAVGHFMSVMAHKLGMVNDRCIKNAKRLNRCIDDATDEEMEELYEKLRRDLKAKNESDVYRLYNVDAANDLIRKLYQYTSDFSESIKDFTDAVSSGFNHADKKNGRAINDVYEAMTEFVKNLRELDIKSRFDVGTYFDPDPTDMKFRNRIKDYVMFWDRPATKNEIRALIGCMIKTSENIRKFDVKWNYTLDYRKDPFTSKKDAKEKITSTDIIRDRSQPKFAGVDIHGHPKYVDKYSQIRRMITYITDALHGGGEHSVVNRIDSLTKRYTSVYDYFNNKLLAERRKKQNAESADDEE